MNSYISVYHRRMLCVIYVYYSSNDNCLCQYWHAQKKKPYKNPTSNMLLLWWLNHPPYRCYVIFEKVYKYDTITPVQRNASEPKICPFWFGWAGIRARIWKTKYICDRDREPEKLEKPTDSKFCLRFYSIRLCGVRDSKCETVEGRFFGQYSNLALIHKLCIIELYIVLFDVEFILFQSISSICVNSFEWNI